MSASPARHLWTIVLAGGDGVRLRPLTRALHGEERPKQFALIHGGRSLLQATVARAARWSRPSASSSSSPKSEKRWPAPSSASTGRRGGGQPSNRAPVPASCSRSPHLRSGPDAKVVILPSDHYVRDEEPFERPSRRAVAASGDQIALVGAVPNQPETQYGWIVAGRSRDIRQSVVVRFCEKPPQAMAERLWRNGALWNTFVMVGTARRFWQLGRSICRSKRRCSTSTARSSGTRGEGRVLRQIYTDMPSRRFPSDVLQKARGLVVVPLHDCGWSDWGTPERVLESLRRSQRLRGAVEPPDYGACLLTAVTRKSDETGGPGCHRAARRGTSGRWHTKGGERIATSIATANGTGAVIRFGRTTALVDARGSAWATLLPREHATLPSRVR